MKAFGRCKSLEQRAGCLLMALPTSPTEAESRWAGWSGLFWFFAQYRSIIGYCQFLAEKFFWQISRTTFHKHHTDNFSSLKQSLPLCADNIGENIIVIFMKCLQIFPCPELQVKSRRKNNAVWIITQAVKDNIFISKRIKLVRAIFVCTVTWSAN